MPHYMLWDLAFGCPPPPTSPMSEILINAAPLVLLPCTDCSLTLRQSFANFASLPALVLFRLRSRSFCLLVRSLNLHTRPAVNFKIPAIGEERLGR